MAVKNLIKEQFDRLERINPSAYNLLCRMGYYRYQKSSAVPLEGLSCLLWNVLQYKTQIINVLVRCSLVECDKKQYSMHSIIKAEAASRLRLSKDWKITNQVVATFWMKSVGNKIESVEDAVQALEAYYHYVEIDAYEEAAKVILHERENVFVNLHEYKSKTTLGSSFHRLESFPAKFPNLHVLHPIA